MKRQKILYWLSTGLFSLWMLGNAYAYLTSEEAKRLCVHFGFPDYFRVELAVAKLIGVIVLVLPKLKGRINEWAYAGFVITVISGFIAHLASGDSFRNSASALVALILVLISYATYHRLQPVKSITKSATTGFLTAVV
ncbi:DoxX family protein [Spirosoma endbachense]|uniref:DoxX family protein n=1 Tax=Spirosoma endbachense TaxID=2666025 RepID=A0A6P1W468_9BACT|nr:DoxX family protein [Spirosoma endbachense]QHV99348.1 DoxX family protein [Spirosoma endbachense]